MTTGVLGQPHRVVYVSKNLVSGLSNVKSYVLRPDLTVVGPFNMAELGHAKFAGVYYFDLITAPLDPVGEYVVVVESPSEDNHRSVVKIPFSNSESILSQINVKTSVLPSDPASDTTVIDRTQAILDDLVDVVRLDDLSLIDGAFNFYAQMSTVFKDATNKHEILTWLNRGGVRLINTSDCSIRFYNADGTLVWQATQATPNADGFYKLESSALTLDKDRNFYVIIDIKDDTNVVRSTTLPTVTVG